MKYQVKEKSDIRVCLISMRVGSRLSLATYKAIPYSREVILEHTLEIGPPYLSRGQPV